MAITKISPDLVDFDSALVVSPTLTIGDATAEDTKIVFDGNAQDYYIGLDDSADDLVIGLGSTVGTTPAIVIDENLSVGIGETAPDRLFHVKRSDSGGTVAKFENSAGTVYIELNTANQAGGDAGYLSYDSNKKLGFWTDDTQHVTVDANGKVGINDASPFAKLHVEDTSWSSGSPYGAVAYIQGGDVNDLNWGHLLISQSGTSTNTGGRISLGANGENPIAGIRAKYKGATYGDLAFLTRPSGGTNTERVVIRSDGTVGIGTDTADTYLDMEYSSTSETHGIHINNQQPGGYGSAITFISKRSDNSATEIAGRINVKGFNSWNSDATASSKMLFQLRHGNTLSDVMVLQNGNLRFEQSGKGIDFSATSDGTTATSELLDDYEEGTWTPVLISGGSTNPTGGGALSPYGSYTKVGNRVTVTFYVGRSWTNTPAGQIFVSGLPFVVENVNGNTTYTQASCYNINFGGGMTMVVPDRNAQTFNMYAVNNSADWTQINWTTHTTSPIYLSGQFSYTV